MGLKTVVTTLAHQVYRAISELIKERVFLELVWASLFHPISKLADGQHKGRLADLFPEEVFSNSNCLAQKPVCNLMTLVSLYSLHVFSST